MSHDAHPLSPLLLLAVDAGVGGLASHVAHALAGIPPGIVGASSALVVGVILRFAGPTIDHHGAALARRLTPAPPVPAGLARCVLIVEDHASGEILAAVLRQTFTATAAIAATLTEVSLLGLAGNPYSQGAVGDVTIADAQVWGTKLTAAQVTADWRRVRGAML